ncbi:hypothetical protein PR003_g17476 [Phytophthora rubi]|uniref:Uncharacterized protein n=1 Tax=Phytophthora rubi TaxID=129364 RepID=A0A6A3HZL6_9STRA|nr:hypothetical protein PR001_g25806 [Phytophthora rubi]KAE9321422.1 hypothetical protein PR003_g17476 [Phytophthora rubi]
MDRDCIDRRGFPRRTAARSTLPAVQVLHQTQTRTFVTEQVYKLAKRVMPRISDTKKAVLDSDTVGFDRGIFSGAPSFATLDKYSVQLNAEEKAFIDNEVQQLCEMIDDYVVTRDQDLPLKGNVQPRAAEPLLTTDVSTLCRTSGIVGELLLVHVLELMCERRARRLLPRLLTDVIAALQPTVFMTAIASKVAGVKQRYKTHARWDRLVFSKLHQALGGNVLFVFSGSAPMSADVKKFVKVVFCCDVATILVITTEWPCALNYLPPYSLGMIMPRKSFSLISDACVISS